MFRSAASLLAKKTAIVAITGVTVIGGASLALANAGDSTVTDPVEDTTTTTESTTTTSESTTTTTESTTTTVAEPTTTTTEAALEPAADEPSAELDDDGDADADGHGAQVSEAARVTCHKAENIEAYGNHGQCVKAFAHGEGVDHSNDEVPSETLAQTDPEPTAAVAPAKAPAKQPKATPAGKGSSGGKGKKG